MLAMECDLFFIWGKRKIANKEQRFANGFAFSASPLKMRAMFRWLAPRSSCCSHMWKKIRRILKWLMILCLLGGGLLAYVAWDIVSYGRRDDAIQSDVAVVLGAAAWDRKPSPVLEERINHAIDLYKRKVVKKVLFTGGFGNGAAMAESEVARDYAIAQGVQATDILTETKSHSTLENVKQAQAVLKSTQLETVVLVSDPLQMRRAMLMMQDLGISAVSSPTPTSRYRTRDRKLEFLFEEVYKYVIYRVAKI